MLFEKDEDLELQPKRTKTLLISIGIHLMLLIFLALNPDLLTSTPKRIIKVMGQDYDLSKEELTELVMPPDALRPKPAVPDKPLVQPPVPPQQNPPPRKSTAAATATATATQPPPPPPPPPAAATVPPVVIGPDDVLKEGARPDAAAESLPRRYDRTGASGLAAATAAEAGAAEAASSRRRTGRLCWRKTRIRTRCAFLPNLMDSAKRIVQQQIDEERRRSSVTPGGRTGLPNGTEDPNFSTEEPTILSDTRGYDFGPYMNQVVNRVRYNWYSLIPEIARLGKRGQVVIIFTITKGGIIANCTMVANSGRCGAGSRGGGFD